MADPALAARDVERASDYKTGVAGEIWGFKLMKRSRIAYFTNAATPVKKAVATADAAADSRLLANRRSRSCSSPWTRTRLRRP